MTKKICFLIDRYVGPIAGTPSQIDKLIAGLKGRGWEIQMAVLRSSEYVESGSCPVPVTLLDVKSIASPRSFARIFSLGMKLRKEGVNIVQIFYNDSSVLAPPILKLLGIKVIISRRDMGYWYTKSFRNALMFTGRFVDGVICNCSAIKEITARAEKIPLRKIHVIYNGYPEASAKSVVEAVA